ncbi:MAG: hypothetical protein JWO38_3632 [Gemmataceae bacterium]|nr:hypothetical protein [Gemmataceae bacterium]
MHLNSLSFGWRVPADGFEWVKAISPKEAGGTPQPALVAASDDGVADRVPPNTDPIPFLRLADLKPAPEEIKRFADRHGNLTETDVIMVDRGGRPGRPARGCFLSIWEYQISALQRVVGLWDLLRRDDTAGLGRYVRWVGTDGEKAVVFTSHPSGPDAGPPLGAERTRAVIASSTQTPERLASFTAGEVIRPAWCYVRDVLDEHLHHVADHLTVAVESDPVSGRPSMGLEAPTLLAAIWLQAAEAISADRTYNRCRACNSWFEVTTGAARSDREYCSNACRSRAYRERQAEARRMYTSGKTFEEIAAELESDAATVRAWITGQKG